MDYFMPDQLVVKLIGLCCEQYSLKPNEFNSRRRQSSYILARRLFIWSARFSGYSQASIARALRKDQTTIAHHLNQPLEATTLLVAILLSLRVDKYRPLTLYR